MIYEVAAKRPQWSFVFVGKADVDCGKLKKLPNVYLMGVRPYSTLPAFARGFTVGIMPFKINRLTENVKPIKLREYLAAAFQLSQLVCLKQSLLAGSPVWRFRR